MMDLVVIVGGYDFYAERVDAENEETVVGSESKTCMVVNSAAFDTYL